MTARGAGRYYDHVAVATGNMTPSDAVDEIVFAVNQRDAVWDKDWKTIVWPPWTGWMYDFFAWNNIKAYILTVSTSPTGTWTIEGWDNALDLLEEGETSHKLVNDAAEHRYTYHVHRNPSRFGRWAI